jgi:K+-dependent Na+/Ca+ exchanger-like protein
MTRVSNFLRLSQKKLNTAQKRQVRKSANKFRIYFAGACISVYATYLFATGGSLWDPIQASGGSAASPAHHANRGRELSGGGCPEFLLAQNGGHVAMYIIVTVYMFLGLAIVCDDFFTPALEKISEKLSLSPDVAGATFLAAGSSAPEFFTSLGDTFSTGNSVGVGTIVGSAMFNILVIVAMAAASATEELKIDWRPVVRDCSFYSISILTMIIFFQDGRIYWWEGLIMVIIYFLYILFMTQNEKIFKMCEKKKVLPEPGEEKDPRYEIGRRTSVHYHKGLFQGKEREIILPDGTKGLMSDFIKRKNTAEFVAQNSAGGGDASADSKPTQTPDAEAGEAGSAGTGGTPADETDAARESGFAAAAAEADREAAASSNSAGEDDDDPDDYWSRFKFPSDDSAFDKFLWVSGLPFVFLFQITIPDCAKTKAEKYYIVTFIMSIGWIGGLCLGMVTFVTWFGCILEIDPVIMGITFLAIGTSIPDAIGSMVVARAGEADMAIANAVGSNVFDILLGLGFPWFLRGAINESNDDKCDDYYPVRKCGIELNVGILFSTVGLFFLTLIAFKWRMNNKLGIVFLVLYLLYIIWTLITALPNGAPLVDLGSCDEPSVDAGCPGFVDLGNKTR